MTRFIIVISLLSSSLYTNTVSFSFGVRWSSESGNLKEWGDISINITPSNQSEQSTRFSDIPETILINGVTKTISEKCNNSITYLLRDRKKEQEQLQKLDDECMKTIKDLEIIINYIDKNKNDPRAQKLRKQIVELKSAHKKRKRTHTLENIPANKNKI